MRNFIFLVVCILAVSLSSCVDREPLSWETEIFLPLVDDHIGWSSFIPDSLVEIGEEGEVAKLVFNGVIDIVSGNLVPILPDTTIQDIVAFGALPISIPVPIEYPFIDQQEEMMISSLTGTEGAYMRELVVASGEMVFTVESSIKGILEMSYYLTCVTLNGDTVGIDLVIPPATDTENGFATGIVDLENALFDLTGTSGVGNNTLTTSFIAIGSEQNEEIFYATNLDSLWMTVEFHDFTVQSAKGYFGNVIVDFDSESPVLDSIPVPNPVLDIEGAVAKLTIENTVGADIRLTFDTLSVDDQNLQHPTFFGVHDVARAHWSNGQLIEKTYLEIDMGEVGSNFFDLIETFPEVMRGIGNLELNPFGDVSLGNDYLDVDVPPLLNLDIEIPIRLGADGVILEEQYTIDPAEFPQFDGRLLIDLYSTFPVSLSANVEYVVNDTLGTVVSVSSEIGPGSTITGYIAHAFAEIPINRRIIEPGGELFVTLDVSTEGAVPFTGYEDVRVQIRIEGTQLIEE